MPGIYIYMEAATLTPEFVVHGQEWGQTPGHSTLMHASNILSVSVSPVHHLHDLHHVQVNGLTLTLLNSQHCINHHL